LASGRRLITSISDVEERFVPIQLLNDCLITVLKV
jgi:hypothetical protein